MSLFKFLKYIPRLFYKRGLPLNLIYFITSGCNARCRHCFYWRRLNTNGKELTLEEIEKVAQSLPGLLALSLTGGEPFLREDLVRIAQIFSRFTGVANLQIPTNGLLTDHIFKTSQEILKKCRRDIRIVVGVSLDDLEEKHDAVRQVAGCWQKAVATIRKLKNLESRFNNFLVGSTITITKENQQRVGKLVDFLKNELGIDAVAVNIIRSEVKDMSLKEVDVKYYDKIIARLRTDFLERSKTPSWIDRVLSSRQYLGSRLLSRIYSQKQYITPCYAGSLLAVLREDGNVYPCEVLDEKMGNLRDFNFNLKRLWFSEQAHQVREKIRKQKCFCTYECAMTLNTLFNPRHLLTILKDSLKRK